MLTKIVDNIQVQIKNIHIRYEDTMFFKQPLSMGITLERLSIKTTNEEWVPEFIDRTLPANKHKPLQKHLDLRNVGFYCNPQDDLSQMVSLVEDPIQRQEKFASFFGEDEQFSAPYDSCYILRPISIEAKYKQLSSTPPPGGEAQKEPHY